MYAQAALLPPSGTSRSDAAAGGVKDVTVAWEASSGTDRNRHPPGQLADHATERSHLGLSAIPADRLGDRCAFAAADHRGARISDRPAGVESGVPGGVGLEGADVNAHDGIQRSGRVPWVRYDAGGVEER